MTDNPTPLSPPDMPDAARSISPAPIVTHAPDGLTRATSTARSTKRSEFVWIGALGAAAIGAFTVAAVVDEMRPCQPDPSDPNSYCERTYYTGHSSWHFSSSGSTTTRTATAVTFGGFGTTGAGHGGGGE